MRNKKPQPVTAAPPLVINAEALSLEMGRPEWIEAQDGGEGEKPKLRQFKMNTYTGGAMNLGFGVPVVIDLAKVKAANRVVLLRGHDPNKLVGHAMSVSVSSSGISAMGVMSGANEHTKEVIDAADNEFPWQLSVGGSSQLEFIREGVSTEVNGKQFKGPVYVARAFLLKEISFVPMGADDKTNAKLVAEFAQRQEGDAMRFEDWLKANDWDIATLSDAQKAQLRAAFDAETAASGTGTDALPGAGTATGTPTRPATGIAASAGGTGGVSGTDALIQAQRDQMASEMERIATIQAKCANSPQIAARAIKEGWTADRAELEAMRTERSAPASAPGVGRSAEITAAAMEVALLRSTGSNADDLVKKYGEKAVTASDHRDLRGASLHTLIFSVLHAAGRFGVSRRVDNDLILEAFKADRELRASGAGTSSISLSGVLSNIANKRLLDSFIAFESVVSVICSETDVNDFKARMSYRVTAGGKLKKVGPTGELTHTTLDEEPYQNKVETYGRMISLTRQDIINDDLGTFMRLPAMFGRMAALAREELVFNTLLPNTDSFFSTGNANYIEGADTALSIGGLSQAEGKFMDQVDSQGKPIVISPKILLVPTGLKALAETINTSQMVNETTSAGKPAPMNNPHAGKFRPVASPYLNAQGITGSSSTAYYLFANPADLAAIEVSYLRGQRNPVIESSEADFDTLGMRWRSYFDFGVDKQDHRAALKSKGAA